MFVVNELLHVWVVHFGKHIGHDTVALQSPALWENKDGLSLLRDNRHDRLTVTFFDQFGIIRDFYRWRRGRGIYLNVPDWYFLQGSSKTGMGYRETNWSLPRSQQVLHTRQNLFDGTREKNPTMGWMFVPLTQYHGGGALATVEPLSEHLDHYERMIASNLAFGAQACYRGPRLYDTEATKAVVKKWVSWYKQHREILESDVIHTSSRRACGLRVTPKAVRGAR